MQKAAVNITQALLTSAALMSSPLVIGSDKQALKFSGSVNAEYGRDSKVVIEEIDLTTSKGDNFLLLKATGGVEYKLTDEQRLSASISVNDKNYASSNPFDLRTLLMSAGYKYKVDNYTFGIDIRRADADLGGNSFLSLTQVSPYVSFFADKKHFFRVAYTNYDKELDKNPTRNSDSDELSIDYYFFYNGLNDYFITTAKYRNSDARDDLFDNKSYQTRFAYKKRYTLSDYPTRLTLQFKYRKRNYDEKINPDIKAFRYDKQLTIGLLNSIEIVDGLSLLVDLSRINNDSNLANLNYNETLVSAGVEYQF